MTITSEVTSPYPIGPLATKFKRLTFKEDNHTPYNKRAGESPAKAEFLITKCEGAAWLELELRETVQWGRSTRDNLVCMTLQTPELVRQLVQFIPHTLPLSPIERVRAAEAELNAALRALAASTGKPCESSH